MTPEERRKRIDAEVRRIAQSVMLRAFLRAVGTPSPPTHFNCRSSVPDPFRELNAELDRLEAEARAGIPTKEKADAPGSWEALEKALGAEAVRRMREGV